MLFSSKYKYDVFISHAVEDKLGIANDLCKRLEEEGLNVWYSGFDLKPGDSIDTTIRTDLPRSKYAVVILSPDYLSKRWTMREYYMLQALEKAGRKVILPVLYNLTADDLKGDVYMADKFSIPFSKGLDFVVSRLLEVIKNVKPEPPKPLVTDKKETRKRAWIKPVLFTTGILTILLALSYLAYAIYMEPSRPGSKVIKSAIAKRIEAHQASITHIQEVGLAKHGGRPATQNEVTDAYAEFVKLKTYYRNEFDFTNGYTALNSKKSIEKELSIDLDALSPYNAYGFLRYSVSISPLQRDGQVNVVTYTFENAEPVTYSITDYKSMANGDYVVTVAYSNNLRLVLGTLIFPEQNFPKRHQLSLKGFLPVERYVFHLSGDTWTYASFN